MNTEEGKEIIAILGEERVEQLYQYLGSRKITFSALHKIILQQKICEALKSSKISFSELAKKLGVSKMTHYRIYHSLIKRL